MDFPNPVPNWIGGTQVLVASGETLQKRSPSDGTVLCEVVRSKGQDVAAAIGAARDAQAAWASTPAVERGQILHAVAMALEAQAEHMAETVARETGKSVRDARAETSGAVAQGLFMAGEGQRLYGRTHTSAVPNRYAMTVRQPRGIAALIIAANTPIANVAWKVFPALICGNTAVLKPSEDAPLSASLFADIAFRAGLPKGVLNVVHGLGEEAGAPLVASSEVDVVSFTGSSAVGRQIAEVCARRTAVVSLELGGKNPLVVCDDADLDGAVKWTVLSGFSNAGQRCASGSRIIVFEAVYDLFRAKLLDATHSLRVGPGDEDDLGPVINERQLDMMLAAVERAQADGARVIAGGERMRDPEHAHGFYMAPTIVEGARPDSEFSTTELFGPIIGLYRVPDFGSALELSNRSPYGLTAAIHTKTIHRSWEYVQKVRAGVAVVNGGTYGSEPHMPFGGRGASGNGTREPGTEALDVYSELKNIYLNIDTTAL